MEQKIKLGISSCLLGEKVRHDGQHKLDRFLKNTLGIFIEWVPVCPEVECGLPTPREAMSLQGDKNNPELYTIRSRKNLTQMMSRWISSKLPLLEKENLNGFVFKKKSPSSALYDAKVHNEDGMPYAKSPGLFAKAFTETFPLIPVEDEGRLNDPKLRENFLERVFVYSRWQENILHRNNENWLADFHRDHKLIIMAHSPSLTSQFGKMAANSKKYTQEYPYLGNHSVPPKAKQKQEFSKNGSVTVYNDKTYNEYINLLMKELKKIATVNKHVNVLQHIMGYFKKNITSWEKQEFLSIIENYHKQLIPLIVPITLTQHYIKKYNKEYLKTQHYIYQHPVELKLRNHV